MLKMSFFEKTYRLNRTSSATKLELERKNADDSRPYYEVI